MQFRRLKGVFRMMKPIKNASEETGLSYHFIRKLCLEGKIKFIKSGNKYYVNMSSLLAYCEGGDGIVERK